MGAKQTCARHSASAAGWKCTDCNRALCPDCTAAKRYGPIDILVCCLCGGRAEELRIRREEVPFQTHLREVWRFPLRRESLPALVGMAVVVAIFQAAISFVSAGKEVLAVFWALVPIAALNVAYLVGIVFGWMMSIARKTASSAEALEGLEVTGLWQSVVRPAWLALVGMAFVWIPAALRISAVGTARFGDPVLLLLAALAVFFTPSVVLGGAAGATALELLNPLRTVGRVFALGRAYLSVLGITALALAVGAPLHAASIRAWAVVPLFGPLILQLFALYPAVVAARAIGILLRVHGDVLGYGVDSDYSDPALPGVAPRGSAEAAPASRAQ